MRINVDTDVIYAVRYTTAVLTLTILVHLSTYRETVRLLIFVSVKQVPQH